MAAHHLEQVLKITASDTTDAFFDQFLFVPFDSAAWPPVSLGFHSGDGPKDPELYCDRELHFGRPFRIDAERRPLVAELRPEINRLVGLGYGLEGDLVRRHLESAATGHGVAAQILSLIDGDDAPFEAVEPKAFLDEMRDHVDPDLPIILESKEWSEDGAYADGEAQFDCDSIETVELIDPSGGALIRVERMITNLRAFAVEEAHWAWTTTPFVERGCERLERIASGERALDMIYVRRDGRLQFREIEIDGAPVAGKVGFDEMTATLEEFLEQA